MQVEITLDPDVVERLPHLRRTSPRTSGEYPQAVAGETWPLDLSEILNSALRRYRTLDEQADGMERVMAKSGALLGDPASVRRLAEIEGRP